MSLGVPEPATNRETTSPPLPTCGVPFDVEGVFLLGESGECDEEVEGNAVARDIFAVVVVCDGFLWSRRSVMIFASALWLRDPFAGGGGSCLTGD